jgi:hypothetical protein
VHTIPLAGGGKAAGVCVEALPLAGGGKADGVRTEALPLAGGGKADGVHMHMYGTLETSSAVTSPVHAG